MEILTDISAHSIFVSRVF